MRRLRQPYVYCQTKGKRDKLTSGIATFRPFFYNVSSPYRAVSLLCWTYKLLEWDTSITCFKPKVNNGFSSPLTCFYHKAKDDLRRRGEEY